jgi:predicted SAM-dependent methyltransferase
MLPKKFANALRTTLGRLRIAHYVVNQYRYLRFKCALKQSHGNKQAVSIVIGASGVANREWIATEQFWHDITIFESWSKYFIPGQIDRILAEHVLEHLHPVETVQAIRNFYTFLRPGGYIRVAVPDGNHPYPGYVENVRPGGIGAGAFDHKVLYTFTSLRDLFLGEGFFVNGLEYFNESGEFHAQRWNPEDGMIFRSYLHDERNVGGINAYSSIIIDAHKLKCDSDSHCPNP